MNTKVISCFPGTGKTYFFENQDKYGIKILDSDSSSYSWLENGERNPEFPQNYIEHIKENLGKVDLILVSSHWDVRDGLRYNRIDFKIVIPDHIDREIYFERYRNRGSSDAFINSVKANWDRWLAEIKGNHRNVYVLNSEEYLNELYMRTKFAV